MKSRNFLETSGVTPKMGFLIKKTCSQSWLSFLNIFSIDLKVLGHRPHCLYRDTLKVLGYRPHCLYGDTLKVLGYRPHCLYRDALTQLK